MLVGRLSGHQVYPVIRSSGHPVIQTDRTCKPTGHAKRPDILLSGQNTTGQANQPDRNSDRIT